MCGVIRKLSPPHRIIRLCSISDTSSYDNVAVVHDGMRTNPSPTMNATVALTFDGGVMIVDDCKITHCIAGQEG